MAYTEKEEEFYQWMRGRFPDFNLADASLFAQFLADIRAEREAGQPDKTCHICGGNGGHSIECTSWCGDTVVV